MKDDTRSMSCTDTWTHRPDAGCWSMSATRGPREIRRFLDGAGTRRCSRYDLLFLPTRGTEEVVVRDEGEDG